METSVHVSTLCQFMFVTRAQFQWQHFIKSTSCRINFNIKISSARIRDARACKVVEILCRSHYSLLWVQWKVAILHSYSVTSVTYMRYCMQDKIEPFVMSYYTAITETCPWLLILWNFLATLPVPERRSKVCGVTGDFDLKEWMWLLWDVVWRSKFKSLQCRIDVPRILRGFSEDIAETYSWLRLKFLGTLLWRWF